MNYRDLNFRSIPSVCRDCPKLDTEYEEYTYSPAFWCSLNMILPTKKNQCKRKPQKRAQKIKNL